MSTYLTLSLNNELFAVPVSSVLEVLQRQRITRVPKSPQHILGIINFRGDILPVFSTRSKFNLPPAEKDDKQVVIVFELRDQDNKTKSVATTTDMVNDVIEINEQEIMLPPELGLRYNYQYVKGLVNKNDEFILLLDIEMLFDSSISAL